MPLKAATGGGGAVAATGGGGGVAAVVSTPILQLSAKKNSTKINKHLKYNHIVL